MQILLATDGSREAQTAAQLLAELPLELTDSITVLTVTPPGRKQEGEAAVASAQEILSHATAGLRSVIREGVPTVEILGQAKEHPADLLVLGARGHSPVERFLLGSVAERVARHATVPVLVVRSLSGPLRRVVVGVDDSGQSARAAEWFRNFPLPAECEVRLVTVIPLLNSWLRSHVTIRPPLAEHVTTLAEHERDQAQQRLRSLVASFAARGKRAVTEVRSGDPALSLLQIAEEEDADVIVVGSHGQTAAERFLLGSVSEKVLRHANCSVLIVK